MCGLTWDFPLYAENIFYHHWLIKKLLWPMAGQNRAKWEIPKEIERVGGVVQCHVTAEGERRWNLTSGPHFMVIHRLIEMG